MEYQLHEKKCASDGDWYWCNCDGPNKFEALMTAARDLIRGGRAMGALEQAVKAFEEEK